MATCRSSLIVDRVRKWPGMTGVSIMGNNGGGGGAGRKLRSWVLQTVDKRSSVKEDVMSSIVGE